VKIHCFWLISSKLTLPTSAYFLYGGTHIVYIHKYIYIYISGFPNLWPTGQNWPAKPLEVALDLSTKKNKIYMKNDTN